MERKGREVDNQEFAASVYRYAAFEMAAFQMFGEWSGGEGV